MVQDTDGGFAEAFLLDVTTDQIAVSEAIHKPDHAYEKTQRVYVNRSVNNPTYEETRHDIVVYNRDNSHKSLRHGSQHPRIVSHCLEI